MTTKNLQTYFNQLERLQARKEAIHKDNNLSQVGKQSLMETVAQQAAELSADALTAFRKEYDALQKEFNANEARRVTAMEAERARWDYAALSFETQQVKNLLSLPVGKIVEAWNSQKHDGLMVRAWAAAVGSVNLSDIEYVALKNEITKAYDIARMTPDIEKVNKNGKALADRAVMLHEDTVAWMSLTVKATDYAGGGRELERLASRIQIKQVYVVDGFIVNVQMNELPSDELSIA